jgi:DNA-binding response OmpR family regulator
MNGPVRVLVVTANPEIAEIVVHVLSSIGCDAVLVPDFAGARQVIDENPPDLLVSEIRLGAFNGLHLAVRIRSRHERTPVILIGPRDTVLESEAARLSAQYLNEPLDAGAFLEMTVRLLRERGVKMLLS